jgi:ankyrin repeat protein
MAIKQLLVLLSFSKLLGVVDLIFAAQNGHLETAELLIVKGADVNAQVPNSCNIIVYYIDNNCSF